MRGSARAALLRHLQGAAAGFHVLRATRRRVRDGAPVRGAPPVDRTAARSPRHAPRTATRHGGHRIRDDVGRTTRSTAHRARDPEPAVARCPSRNPCCASSTTRSGSIAPPRTRSRSSPGGCWRTTSPSCSRSATTPRASPSSRRCSWEASVNVTRRRCSAPSSTSPSTNGCATASWPRRTATRSRSSNGRSGSTPGELAGGFGMPSVLPISGQIEESFRRRIADLPLPSQRFLTVAAAEPMGDPVIVWRAAGALDLSPDDASLAVDAGLVEIGFRVSFRHPLVRSAAYGGASTTDRQAAHRELAQATDPDVDPDRHAWHRALGSAGPDEDIRDGARALGRTRASAGRVRRRGRVLRTFARAHGQPVAPRRPGPRGSVGAPGRRFLRPRHEPHGGGRDDAPQQTARRAQLGSLRAYLSIHGGNPKEAAGLATARPRCSSRSTPRVLECSSSRR